ncbi:MotA/TolQ/ExbB proton channel family protein, partial [Bacillus nitratireducens]|uniref:MotA/TolQ/ExbB proton channel family protein n=1 Tax=Bacillus nitratireducens TaxID=2026193 RepID=UPI0028524EAB
MEYIFVSGFNEFKRLRTTPIFSPEFVVENVRRAMEASAQREENVLHKSLSWLATTGSVAPYFGLFGTVIGVMNSFVA